MNKLLRMLTPFLCLAGALIFLLLGVRTVNDRKTFLPVTGTIEEIRVEYGFGDEHDRHEVFVRYTVDGTERVSELGEYDSSMAVGKSIDILYDPENPDKIMAAGLFGTILTFAMSALCLFTFALITVKHFRGEPA